MRIIELPSFDFGPSLTDEDLDRLRKIIEPLLITDKLIDKVLKEREYEDTPDNV